jgi:CBS domain-containing protein
MLFHLPSRFFPNQKKNLKVLLQTTALKKLQVISRTRTPINIILDYSTIDVFMPIPGDLSIANLLEIFTRGVHRMPVTNKDGAIESIVRLLYFAFILLISSSQSSLIRFLTANNNALLNKAASQVSATVKELKLGSKKVVSIPHTKTAADAFKIIDETKLDALAIVDENENLIGTISASDLRVLLVDFFFVFTYIRE